MRPSRFAIGLIALLAVVGAAGASGHYDVTATPNIDTPDRTVTFDRDDFTVTELGRVDPGEDIGAEVDAPSGEAYYVTLYDADRNTVVTKENDSDDEYAFETTWPNGSDYAPGTYVVAVDRSGILAVSPVVIAGYHVSVDAPGSAEPGDEITVEADVTTEDDTKPIDQVTAVIGNDAEKREVALTEESSDHYAATFTLDQLPEGDYSLYVVVQGEKQVLDRQEVLGASDTHDFDIATSADDGTNTESDESSSSSQPPPAGSTEAGTQTPSTATATATPGPTTAPPTDGGEQTPGSTATAGGTDGASTATATSAGTVITPNPPTTGAPSTASPGQALGLLPPLVGLALAVLLARRR